MTRGKTPLLLGLALAALMSGGTPARPQDPAKASAHNSPDPHKCKRCSTAYEKALTYVHKGFPSASFPAQMVIGWLFLADGRYPNELQQILRTAMQWESLRGNSQHAQNWYPALAGMLLAEEFKHRPTLEIQQALQKIVDHFVKVQERTGGWFKWFEGAYNDRKDYPVKDLGILDSIIFGFLWSAKAHGVKVPEDTMQKADKCILDLLGGSGISYGTGQHGGDPTGARGSFAMLGLVFAGQTQHRICKTYDQYLSRAIPNMDKGHHVGAFHCLGEVLGCHLQGPAVYAKLTAAWLDKLIDKQDADGGVYIGDDGDAGGEKGLLGGNIASTASFALLILLQDGRALQPPPKGKSGPKTNKPNPPDGAGPGTPTKSSDAKPGLGFRANAFAGSLEVTQVVEKGPSDSAGLKVSDLIVEFKGRKIETVADLRAELAKCSPGQKVTLVVLRGGERLPLDVKLGVSDKSADPSSSEGESF